MLSRLKPSQFLLIFFCGIITAGTILLWLPALLVKSPAASGPGFIDSLFMATSAVCVTGLSVVDIGTQYTIFGQLVLLCLIQIGGLGYMTMATLIALLVGKITLREKLIIREVIDLKSFDGVKKLLKHIIAITAVFEIAGAVVFTACFLTRYTFGKALYYGIFHSVSSFCNSGLSLWSNSLEGFKSDYIVMFTTMILIICGGIGYLVLKEVSAYRSARNLSAHSQVVINTTLALIIAGFFGILITEFRNPATLGQLPLADKVVSALFHSVTPRTAGFSTLPVSGFSIITLFLLAPFMFIGASPGGTGGGVKTTTFALIISTVWSTIRGKRDINLCHRRISYELIRKAISVVVLGITVIFAVTLIVVALENFSFEKIFFEVTSAFGTVGLSTGITPHLSDIGKLIIVITMFTGRLGTLTIGMATLRKASDVPYRYPEEKVMIG